MAGKQITINTISRRLFYYEGERLIKEYPVAVGKPATPTPPGNYKIKNKVVNPGGVLGTRWLGMTIPGGNYGIHGTNNPASIGTAASLGCVRMHNRDVEELFPQITIGTPVTIANRSVPAVNPTPTTAPTPASTTTAAPTPTPTGTKTYTIRAGDTFWKIAQAHNVPLKQLLAANSQLNPEQLQPGQIITIP